MKYKTLNIISILLILNIFLSNIYAQNSEGLLNTDRLYKDYEFTGEFFRGAKWTPDGSAYIKQERSKEHKNQYDFIKYDLKTGKKSVYLAAEKFIPKGKDFPLKIRDYSWSPKESMLLIFTNTKKVWRYHTKGDYWVLNLKTSELKQLGKNLPESSLMFTKFSPDETKVAYVSGHNIYTEDLKTGKTIQLTNDGSDDIINGTFDWVYEEEFSCKDGFRWSPDSKKIAFWKLDATGVKDFLMINNTDSLYSFVIPVEYPKVGETLSSCKVGVISAKGGNTVWAKVEGDPRSNYIPYMEWASNSNEIMIQYLNRLQNKNQLLLCNASTGNTKEIYSEKDEAWLDHVTDIKWMPDGKHFTWISEKSGWKHIYLVSRDGKTFKPITKGNFDVISIEKIDAEKGYIYYIASPENATQRYLYRIKTDGKSKPERITPEDLKGTHSYNITPDANYAIHDYSAFEIPSITDIVSLPSHEIKKVLVENKILKEKYSKLKKKPVEFFNVTIEGNINIDGYMIKPYNFDESKKYPVLFYVYGEPWGQTARDRWSGTRYLWHLMLAQKGYIVISMDTRGTPCPKGRAWRKACYEKMGVQNSHEQALAAKEVFKQYSFIDTSRVAIWGWSGGGSSTLNALLRYPEIYKTGMAVAPVPDIHLYDAIYQERYMGLLEPNKEKYKESSPVTHAKNLKGNLLIVHGTGDDNVHYQGTQRLVNEFIKHNKMFTVMPYPNRSHGIYEGENTSRHLRYLLMNYLLKNTPAGAK